MLSYSVIDPESAFDGRGGIRTPGWGGGALVWGHLTHGLALDPPILTSVGLGLDISTTEYVHHKIPSAILYRKLLIKHN